MNLLDKLPKVFKKDSPKENPYLSLTLTPDKILASVWEFNPDESVQIIGYGEKSDVNKNNLVHQAAIAIDTAGKEAKSDVSKVVFGLSQNWFKDANISEETSKILKGLSEDLELDPQAFISIAASVNHLLKIEEQVTPKAIVLGIFNDFFEVNLIENNSVSVTKTAEGTPHAEKIFQLIKELKKDDRQLPPRIIIYGPSKEPDTQILEKIEKSDWQELFLHEPKITVLSDREVSKSTTYAQAEDVLGHEPQGHSLLKKDFKPASDEDKSEEKLTGNEFGFVEGEDILEEASFQKEPPQKIIEEKAQIQDILEENSPPQESVSGITSKPKTDTISEMIFTMSWFPKIFAVFKNRTSLKGFVIFLVAFLILALGGLIFANQMWVSSQVTIKANAKTFQKDFNVTVVKDGSFDAAKLQIPGQEITAQETGSQKAVASGTKKIGQNAKGEITAFNWTTSATDFSKGTVVISKNGIKFETDDDIEVASRSASTPGQQNVKVTATDFGSDGNIGAGNDFTFQKYDELLYSARNTDAFTGGDEKTVTVASQDDLDKLEKSLTDSLTEKSKTSLKNKASGKQISDDAILVKILKKQFDKKLDEEASLINLDMEIEAGAIVYDENDLKNLLAEAFKNEIPQNTQIKPENIEISNVTVKRLASSLSLSGSFQAPQVPKFDENLLKSKIAGKSQKDARAIIIKEIPDVSDVEVKFLPNLPLASSISPNKSKISFKIEAL